MTDPKPIATLAVACALLVALPVAAAQNAAAEWQGQDSEFGSIRAPFMASMDGERVSVEARIVLRENYEEKDSRFFMFGWTVEQAPALDVEFQNLIRMDTGAELPCYQKQGDKDTAIKCFVDLKDMPPEGTEIRMYGTVGAERAGGHQVGAIIVPFTYTWMRVQMSNGLNAELYASTQVNVAKASNGGGTGFVDTKSAIPAPGLLGVAAAVAVVVALVAARRRAQ